MTKKNKNLSPKARAELQLAIASRYRSALRNEKVRILDEFTAVTGYHRKHAIRLLRSSGSLEQPSSRAPRLRVYDQAVSDALVMLWEASDRVCGKRLKPLLPILVGALERHSHLQLAEVVRSKILAVSAATIDRLLAQARGASDSRGARVRAAPGVRASVPVRTFGDWKEPPPGFLEGDLVSHGGETMAGSFVHTLTLTDIASGWTECVALVVRESGTRSRGAAIHDHM